MSPTLLLHGDQDTDVPFTESAEMAEESAKHKLEHRLIRMSGGEHGFEGADPQAVENTDGIT
jgi:dipeptidyl aminopeptidase/acylaminoacyl peptidase